MDGEACERDPVRPGGVVGLVVGGAAMGAFLGAATNAVNGRASPEYFRAVLRWEDVQDVARASVAQGLFEGLLFGLALGTILAVVVGVVARGRCSPSRAAGLFLGVGATAMACWLAGGLLSMGLASFSPEFFRHAFRGVPEGTDALLCYAWVGGSINGLQFGGVVATAIAAVLFRARWGKPAPPDFGEEIGG